MLHISLICKASSYSHIGKSPKTCSLSESVQGNTLFGAKKEVLINVTNNVNKSHDVHNIPHTFVEF